MLISSEKISYDLKEDTISASGKVTITQCDNGKKIREITSDKIEYNRKTGIIKLLGKTVLKERDGEIIESLNIEIDDDLKKGIIEALLIKLKDKSEIAAEKGTKNNHTYTLLKANYSPCYNDKNCKYKLWDLYADSVVYDTKNKMFTYHNAKLRMKGYTLLYTPFFSHPSFDVKRKSGFVAPIMHSNNDTGTIIGIPYFFALSPSKNLKVTPFLCFKRRGFVATEYVEAFRKGDMKISSSILSKLKRKRISEEEKKNRWHFKYFYQTRQLDNRRFIVDITRASDITYLLKYPAEQKHIDSIMQRKCNTSQVGAEFFSDEYFVDIKTYSFQTKYKKENPVVFPKIHINYEKNKMSFDCDALFLRRDKKNLGRFLNRLGWNHGIISDNGIVLDFNVAGRVDAYQTKTFLIFENGVSCSYPMHSKISHKTSSVWEPKIALSGTICERERCMLNFREDSITNIVDDLSLFEINKFKGIDYIDRGEKLTCGFENSLFFRNKKLLNFFIGQSKHAIGKATLNISDVVSLRTRFVGAPCGKHNKIFECGSRTQFSKICFDFSYFGDKQKNKYRDFDLSQIGGSVSYKINSCWKIVYSQIFNLKKGVGHKSLSSGIFAKYKNECLDFGIGVYKSHYRDLDLKPKTGIIITFSFKTLGNFSQNLNMHQHLRMISSVE